MLIYKSYNPRLKHSFIVVTVALVVLGVLSFPLYSWASERDQQNVYKLDEIKPTLLIDAVKSFLSSTNGQQWMASQPPAASYPLPLPVTNLDEKDCKQNNPNFKADANLQSFCEALPEGFNAAAVNIKGQLFKIFVLAGPNAAPGAPPSTYGFMVLHNGF